MLQNMSYQELPTEAGSIVNLYTSVSNPLPLPMTYKEMFPRQNLAKQPPQIYKAVDDRTLQ